MTDEKILITPEQDAHMRTWTRTEWYLVIHYTRQHATAAEGVAYVERLRAARVAS
jgi:hypothetical protein